jgi:hypothetical protein
MFNVLITGDDTACVTLASTETVRNADAAGQREKRVHRSSRRICWTGYVLA